MCDKDKKTILEITQILRTASQDGIDKQTMDAKLTHMQEKLNHLMEQMIMKEEVHKRELKEKDKQIRKLKEKQKDAFQKGKLEKAKKNKNKKFQQHYSYDFLQYCSGQKKCGELYRQIEKKIQAQAKLSQLKKENEQLLHKLKEQQSQIEELKQQLQSTKILLNEAFALQSASNISQPRNQFSQNQMSQAQYQRQQPAAAYGIMDLSQGKPNHFCQHQEELKPCQDIQTDDQEGKQTQSQQSQQIFSDKSTKSTKNNENKSQQQSIGDIPLVKSTKSSQNITCLLNFEQNGYESEGHQIQQNNQPSQVTPNLSKPKDQTPQNQGRFSWIKYWVFGEKRS